MSTKSGMLRFFVIITVLLVSGVLLWNYINGASRKSKASGASLSLKFSETSGTFSLADKTIDAVLLPDAAGSNITGFDVVYTTTGVTTITDINPLLTVSTEGGTAPTFTELKKEISPNKVRVAYVLIPSSSTPGKVTSVSMRITLHPTDQGNGTLSVDTAKTQVTGDIAGYVYGVAADQGSYAFQNEQVTPILSPTASISPTPIPQTTDGPTNGPVATITPLPPTEPPLSVFPTGVLQPPCPSYGDVDCNGKIDISDLDNFINNFNSPNPTQGDIDGNGKVDLQDYESWRSQYYKK